jgi:hypothetical protein
MNYIDDAGTFIMGMIVALFFVLIFTIIFPREQIKLYDNAIVECEKTLPRNQHCVVIAVPVDKN